MKLKQLKGLFDTMSVHDDERVTLEQLSDEDVTHYTWIFDHTNASFVGLPCNCTSEEQLWKTMEQYCKKDFFPYFKDQMQFVPQQEMMKKKNHDWRGLYAHTMSLQDFGNQIKQYFYRTSEYFRAPNKQKGR